MSISFGLLPLVNKSAKVKLNSLAVQYQYFALVPSWISPTRTAAKILSVGFFLDHGVNDLGVSDVICIVL